MPDKEMVLDLGVEGGGATVFRKPLGSSGWQFVVGGSSMDMDENDDDTWRFWESEPFVRIEDAVRSITRDDEWVLFWPMMVHSEYQEIVWKLVQETAQNLPDEQKDRWDDRRRWRWRQECHDEFDGPLTMAAQTNSEPKRPKIVHDFAKWTALSALRSGAPLKSAVRVYSLIDQHAELHVLFDVAGVIDEAEFDRWHKKTVLAFCDAEPDLPVGWAAKIINVYLKTRVYLAGEGRVGLEALIHPPIDNGLQRGLRKQFPNWVWKIKRIKDFRSYDDDYRPFIEDCRSLAKKAGCLLIELEAYWRRDE